jgi:hypothetical protein
MRKYCVNQVHSSGARQSIQTILPFRGPHFLTLCIRTPKLSKTAYTEVFALVTAKFSVLAKAECAVGAEIPRIRDW